MILQNVTRQVPVLEAASHDEWLELIQKDFLETLLLEHQEYIVEQEVAILNRDAKLNGNSQQGPVPFC